MHNLTSTTVLALSTELLSIADFERVFRATVIGQFAAAQAAARYMIGSGGGSIINMSSIGGHGGMPRRAAYTACAAAIVNLTRTLAVEWAPSGIHVNAIAPAWVMTDALKHYDEQFSGSARLRSASRTHTYGAIRWGRRDCPSGGLPGF